MNNGLKLIPGILLTGAVLTTVSLMALSQTPIPPTPQPSAPLNIGQIRPQPIPDRSVGLDPGKIVRWSLRDAIMMALENNVEIQIEKENVRLAEYDLFAARGFYDPTFTSRISWAPQRTPNAFAFSGTTANATVQNATIVNFGLIRP